MTCHFDRRKLEVLLAGSTEDTMGGLDAADVPAFRAKRALELAVAAGANALRDLTAIVESAK